MDVIVGANRHAITLIDPKRLRSAAGEGVQGEGVARIAAPMPGKVVRLLAEGRTNKEAAAIMGLSVRTIESHRAAVIQRPGVGTFAGLVRYAVRLGIISA